MSGEYCVVLTRSGAQARLVHPRHDDLLRHDLREAELPDVRAQAELGHETALPLTTHRNDPRPGRDVARLEDEPPEGREAAERLGNDGFLTGKVHVGDLSGA